MKKNKFEFFRSGKAINVFPLKSVGGYLSESHSSNFIEKLSPSTFHSQSIIPTKKARKRNEGTSKSTQRSTDPNQHRNPTHTQWTKAVSDDVSLLLPLSVLLLLLLLLLLVLPATRVNEKLTERLEKDGRKMLLSRQILEWSLPSSSKREVRFGQQGTNQNEKKNGKEVPEKQACTG